MFRVALSARYSRYSFTPCGGSTIGRRKARMFMNNHLHANIRYFNDEINCMSGIVQRSFVRKLNLDSILDNKDQNKIINNEYAFSDVIEEIVGDFEKIGLNSGISYKVLNNDNNNINNINNNNNNNNNNINTEIGQNTRIDLKDDQNNNTRTVKNIQNKIPITSEQIAIKQEEFINQLATYDNSTEIAINKKIRINSIIRCLLLKQDYKQVLEVTRLGIRNPEILFAHFPINRITFELVMVNLLQKNFIKESIELLKEWESKRNATLSPRVLKYLIEKSLLLNSNATFRDISWIFFNLIVYKKRFCVSKGVSIQFMEIAARYKAPWLSQAVLDDFIKSHSVPHDELIKKRLLIPSLTSFSNYLEAFAVICYDYLAQSDKPIKRKSIFYPVRAKGALDIRNNMNLEIKSLKCLTSSMNSNLVKKHVDEIFSLDGCINNIDTLTVKAQCFIKKCQEQQLSNFLQFKSQKLKKLFIGVYLQKIIELKEDLLNIYNSDVDKGKTYQHMLLQQNPHLQTLNILREIVTCYNKYQLQIDKEIFGYLFKSASLEPGVEGIIETIQFYKNWGKMNEDFKESIILNPVLIGIILGKFLVIEKFNNQTINAIAIILKELKDPKSHLTKESKMLLTKVFKKF